MQDTIGIDISKDTLDIHRQSDGRHARFGNDKAGLAALRRWIGKTPVRVVYEATGRYHRDMEAALDAAGHALVKVNPGRTRRFAQAAGYGAKTDRVDARLLAQLGVLHRRAIALLAGLAARRSPRFKPLPDRLRDTGREPKAAIIAIARKRLVTFNAMVRDDAEFEPTTA